MLWGWDQIPQSNINGHAGRKRQQTMTDWTETIRGFSHQHASGLQNCAFGVPAWTDFGVPNGCVEVSDLALGESVLLFTPAL